MRVTVIDRSEGRVPSLALAAAVGSGGLQEQVRHALRYGIVQDISLVTNGMIDGELLVGDFSIPFQVEGVRDSDEAELLVESEHYFSLNIKHGARGPCRARCWDGTENHPCVTCQLEEYTFRICC